jgi:hypothetical protein
MTRRPFGFRRVSPRVLKMVNKKTKDDLFAAQGLLATGSDANRPYQKDGRLLVRTSPPGGKATYRVLADATGKLTAAGRHWEDEYGDGEPLLTVGIKGQTFNEQQPVTQRGASEFIKLRSGREVIVRSWNGLKYIYTALGRKYFQKQRKEYVIEVPVIIRGMRTAQERGRARARDGGYQRKAFMPVSHFGVSQIFANASLSPAQLEKRIKDLVLKKLAHVENEDGDKILHEESQEIWILDPAVKCRYSELTVLQHAGARREGGGKLENPLRKR